MDEGVLARPKPNPKFANKIVIGQDSDDEESKKSEHQGKQFQGQAMNLFGKQVAADELMELESLDIASSVAPSKK